MNYKFLAITLLLAMHHTSWTMGTTTLANPESLIPTKAFAPSGLSLEQDEERMIKLMDLIPRKIDVSTDFQSLSTAIYNAQAAISTYLKNPAIAPDFKNLDYETKGKKLFASFKHVELALMRAKVQYMLSPQGQEKLREYKRKVEHKKNIIQLAGFGAAVLGATYLAQL